MFVEMALAAVMMAGTTLLHAALLMLAAQALEASNAWLDRGVLFLREGIRLAALVVWITGSHFLTAIGWALLFVLRDHLHSFEEALYFASITTTTVGYGDIVPDEGWRLLAAACGANGFILFGVSVALIFDHLMRFRAHQIEVAAARPRLKSVHHGPHAGDRPEP